MLEIKEKYPDVLYLIAGKGPYLETIIKKTKEMNLENNVKFLGWITEPEKSLKVPFVTVTSPTTKSVVEPELVKVTDILASLDVSPLFTVDDVIVMVGGGLGWTQFGASYCDSV